MASDIIELGCGWKNYEGYDADEVRRLKAADAKYPAVNKMAAGSLIAYAELINEAFDACKTSDHFVDFVERKWAIGRAYAYQWVQAYKAIGHDERAGRLGAYNLLMITRKSVPATAREEILQLAEGNGKAPPRSQIGEIIKKHKPKPKKKAKKKAPPVKDANGDKVPETLRDVFSDQSLRGLYDQLSVTAAGAQQSLDMLEAFAKKPRNPWLGYAHLERAMSAASEKLKQAAAMVEHALAHAVCPDCKGEAAAKQINCPRCMSEGWMPKHAYDDAINNEPAA